MSYTYKELRPSVFTEEGQVMLLKIRDEAFRLCAAAGCVQMKKLIAATSGDSWLMLACVDRLVELGDLIEIPQQSVAEQDRIFRRPR